jgi:hypothetical protein
MFGCSLPVDEKALTLPSDINRGNETAASTKTDMTMNVILNSQVSYSCRVA